MYCYTGSLVKGRDDGASVTALRIGEAMKIDHTALFVRDLEGTKSSHVDA